jgi:restriction system protein
MHREAARAPAARVRAEADARREAEYAHRAYLFPRYTTKEHERPYSGKSVTELNADLEPTVKALESILAAALKAGALVSFSSLKKPVSPPVWRPPELEPRQLPGFLELDEPTDSTALSGLSEELKQAVAANLARKRQAEAAERAKYEQAEAARQAKYEQVLSEHREREEQRSQALASARAEWQAAVNAGEIDTFEADYRRGDLDAIVSYCSLVLGLSRYPDGFPQEYKFAYMPESRQAIVEGCGSFGVS